MKLVQKLLEKHGLRQSIEAFVLGRRSEATPLLRVLGLDINTNSTGYVVLDEHGRMTTHGHVCTKHLASGAEILAIGATIVTQLKLELLSTDIHSSHHRWVIGIEDFLKTFARGKFHTKGLFQLAQLNGVVSYGCWTAFGSKPWHVHPTSARSFFHLQVPRNGNGTKQQKRKDAIKQIVLEHAVQCEPIMMADIEVTAAAFDVADAYVVASYTYLRDLIDAFVQTEEELKTRIWPDLEAQLMRQIQTRESSKKGTFSKAQYMHDVYATQIEAWVKTHRSEILSCSYRSSRT
jgi:hypothetical protein